MIIGGLGEGAGGRAVDWSRLGRYWINEKHIDINPRWKGEFALYKGQLSEALGQGNVYTRSVQGCPVVGI